MRLPQNARLLAVSVLIISSGAISGRIFALSAAEGGVDLHHLPVGDGHVSTSPKVGYVWSCQSAFGGGGAAHDGPWMNNDGTFDLTAKALVDGDVRWPSSFAITVQGDKRVIAGNGLPNHPTGDYPIKQTDDAYQYDRNPNSIQAQTLRFELPANPTLAAQPSCVALGPIGVLVTGGVFFNALDAAGKDAVAHEVQDACLGHPERSGSYHYHALTGCLDKGSSTGHSSLVGYALDGFGIYGFRGENGQELTNGNLDSCHGHTHLIEWNGKMVEMYHYHATHEYPYTVGCYRGTAIRTAAGPPGTQPNATATPTGASQGSTASPTPLSAGVSLPGNGSRTFSETGKTVRGIFLDYWNSHGGLAQFGYPLSDVASEVSDLNGKPYMMQYFERAVFEYHPEYQGTQYEVLLSQLGTIMYKQKHLGGQ
jgi:hypothetical protein